MLHFTFLCITLNIVHLYLYGLAAVIMNKSEEQFLDIVFNNLMSLPAYRLKNKYREIFQQFAYTELNKLIKNQSLTTSLMMRNNYKINNQFISEVYKRPNKWERVLFSFRTLPNIYKLTGWMAIISFLFSFLIKSSNLLLILIGVICSLIFLVSSFIYWMNLSFWDFYVEGTFFTIETRLDDIKEYIRNFGDINEKNLHRRANKITISIINNDLSILKYRLRKIDSFNIVFAVSITVVAVYVLGDSFIDDIKWIANNLNFGDFKYIKELDIQKFTASIFGIGIVLGRGIMISALEQKEKDLNKSMDIFNTILEERDSS